MNKPNLTVEMIKNAILKYREANGGQCPHFKCGDATEYFGFEETWGNVDKALQRGSRGLEGGSSLSKFLFAHGMKVRKEEPVKAVVPQFSAELLKAAVLKYREAHDGRSPHSKRGDAAVYFGFPCTWKDVDYALNHGKRGFSGKTTLSRFCLAM